jgi:ABC-type taurine transport system substrate-binding protein
MGARPAMNLRLPGVSTYLAQHRGRLAGSSADRSIWREGLRPAHRRAAVGFRLPTILALGLLLSACGSAASSSGSGSSPASSPAASAAAAKPANSAAAAPAKPAAAGSASAQPAAAASAAAKPAGSPPASLAQPPGVSAPAASGAIAVNAGYIQSSFTNSPVQVALSIGAFARQGLNVTLTDTVATAQSAALTSGELQFGTLGSAELVNANAAGTPYVMVASLADVPAFSLYAKPGLTMNDLAGKQVGVGRLGSATFLAGELFLRQFGLTGKAKIVATGGADPAVIAAMSAGQLEAGVLAPPSTSEADKAGFKELVNGPKLGITWTSTGVMLNRAYLTDHRDVVRRYAKGLQEGWTYLGDPANKDAVLKILAAQTKSNADVAESGYDYMFPVWTSTKIPTVDPKGIATAISLADDPKAANLKPEDLIDNSLLQS